MADIPDTIVLKRDRDMEGRGKDLWIRRTLMFLIAALSIAALANVFGQRPSTAHASAGAASLSVSAPTSVRGGLLWQARFEITAHQEVEDAILVLGTGWIDGNTVNTIEPSPVGEASDNGKLSLDLGHISAGRKYLLFMDFQTNPTTVGERSRTLALYDGKTRLLGIDQSVTVFP
ncbi:MAG TPA: hypothetical protein VF895_10940 [Gaiellaceae bacterium]